MSNASVTHRRVPLRRDLRTIRVEKRPRPYRIVIDEIGGRFTRVSEHVWQSLSQQQEDEQLWQQARAAGWTRERTLAPRRVFSPLYFRIPFGSFDGIATRLAPLGGIFFSAPAMLLWGALIAIAAVLAASRSAELLASLGSLQLFLKQADPVGLAILLAGTKLAHELGHAVMCRRAGSRCGSAGVLMLCGVPCPYCDVTDVWRQPSAAVRAAVMLAGIYIELIIASLATCVWVCAADPAVRLEALNLMVVCGISTIVFNANPLMRYDGYYVLGDLIGSTNLRQEARDAFRSVVTARMGGTSYCAARRGDLRSVSLAGFHAVSTVYRCLVAIAIATLVLGAAQYLNLRPIAVAAVIIAALAGTTQLLRRIVGIARGAGNWRRVPLWRRGPVALGIGLLAAAVLFIPFPRYRVATGWVDAASAQHVYVPGDGIIQEVTSDIGQSVRAGETLFTMHLESLAIRQAKLSGQLRVAKLRGSLSRRVTLDRSDLAEQWRTLQAAEDAVAAQLASVDKRVRDSAVAAPVGGVILPPKSALKWVGHASSMSLRDRVGTGADAFGAWCRISPDGKLSAVLVVDARDRTNIDVGTAVRISLTESPSNVFVSTVTSVSAIQQDEPSVTRQAAYQVLCPLPDVRTDEMLRWLGKECKGVFCLPNRTLASDMTDRMGEWLAGT